MGDETLEARVASGGIGRDMPGRNPTIFVADAATESVRIADTLRTAGYHVVDLPLSSLVGRSQAERPNVVLLDVDVELALDEIARLRRLPGAGAIDFVYFGSGTGSIRSTEEAISNEGSAFFRRPVDLGALVRRIEALTGGPTPRSEGRLSTPPPKLPARRSSTPPERSSAPSLPAPGLRTPGPPLPMSVPSLADLVDPPRALATFGTVSSELQQLLAEAELRAEIMPQPEAPLPTPEEEIEAVLPADLLASLDEPIEGDEDDEHDRPGTGVGHGDGTGHGKPTTAGGSKQTTTASGGRPNSSAPQHTLERRVSDSSSNEIAPRRVQDDWSEATNRLPLGPAPRPDWGTPKPREDWTLSETTDRSRVPPGDGSKQRLTTEMTHPSRPLPARSSRRVGSPTPLPPALADSSVLDEPRSDGQKPDSVTIAAVGDPRTPSQAPTRGPSEAPARAPTMGVVVVGPIDARRFLADAIARRLSGALCFEHERVVRRLVVRDGDLVTAASGAERESLVCFLGARGELPRDEVERLAGKIPPYGRHAGAALVAHGWLGQDQLWSVLRAHAEWIATSVLRLPSGTAQLEVEPPGRLRSEPSVFAATTGAEVFVELVRRAVAPDEAIASLGGEASRVGDGPRQALLAECSLPPAELELVSRARGGTLGDLLARSPDADIASVVHGLALLGVLDVLPAIVPSPNSHRPRSRTGPAESEAEAAALDEEAIRARIRARLELVDEGDYFAVLGVSRDATSYEVRRAFVELRRVFEPSRILTPRLHDLEADVKKIVVVLEEAYEILRDVTRRERYRRAIDATAR
jgi:hypothetical protein